MTVGHLGHSDTPLKDVARLLVDNAISGVPVVGRGEPCSASCQADLW
jgi:CBS domain-containing protein